METLVTTTRKETSGAAPSKKERRGDLRLKTFRLGLRARLTVWIECCVVILVLVLGIMTTAREKEVLEQELRKRGLALASDLARFSVRPLLGHDPATLRRFVNHSKEQDYVRYVMILDPSGKVIMHSDLSQVGRIYTDDLTLAAMRSGVAGSTDVHSGRYEESHCDIYVPIRVADTVLGTARLGYSHLAIEKEIAAAQKEALIVGLCTAVAGGVAAYFLAGFIALPIRKITGAIGKVAGGSRNPCLVIRRRDEIGTLADAFNQMTEELNRTTVSKDHFDNIIQSMKDVLAVVDPGGRIRSVNRTTCDLLGYEESDLIGMEIGRFISEEERLCSFTDFLTLIESSKGGNREIEVTARKGKRIPMLLSSAVLKDKEGNLEGAVCIARDITDRKEAEEALRQSERELHLLSSQLIRAQEDERKRLSVELHDDLGQSLMVLKLQLRSIREGLRADQNGLRRECDEMIGYLREVTENVRRLSRDLSPAILEDLGLSAAVRTLVDGFGKYSGAACSIDWMEGLDDAFSCEEEIAIYRILQECLTNVAKHAEASRVALLTRDEARGVVFRVEDNGRGFNVVEAFHRNGGPRGLGLATLCERVRMIGGTIEIWSQEGEGTRITFTVPVHGEGGDA